MQEVSASSLAYLFCGFNSKHPIFPPRPWLINQMRLVILQQNGFLKCDFEEIGKCNTTGFPVFNAEKWLFYWRLYCKCDITPERCRPVTFPGAVSLDVLFQGLNGQIPIMCSTPKDKIIMTWGLQSLLYFWVNHDILIKLQRKALMKSSSEI